MRAEGDEGKTSTARVRRGGQGGRSEGNMEIKIEKLLFV
jgi:hypothetical protein